MDTILIIRLGRLGDVTLTGPTIKNLRFLFPRSRLILITREIYRPLAERIPFLNHVLTFPDEGSYFDLVRLSSEIDDFQPELVVDLHKNFRSFHLANLSKARYKVVYKKRRKQRQAAVQDKRFVDPVPHTIDLYNLVIDQLKGERIARRPDLMLDDDTLFGLHSGRRTVALAPGAGSPVKAWPADRFARVAERIIHDFDIPVDVYLGQAETHLAAAFETLPQDKISIHQALPLPEIVSRLACARLSLTNDSGLMHLSSATGTPTVALFGPTHEQLGFAPLGVHDIMLATDEKCRPCSLHGSDPCYREEQYCFTRLTVDFVYEKVAERLEAIDLAPAVFIDRDGTLIVDKHYLADPDKIEFIPGSLEAVEKLKRAGYRIIIVSNQSGVARAFFPVDCVEAVHRRLWDLMAEKNCEPDDIRYCPYHPDGDDPVYTRDSYCRKPKPGMLEEAAARLGIDMKRSFMVGDKLSDIQCGQAAGALPILVRTGEGAGTEDEYPPEPYPAPYHICDDFSAAATFIVSRQ